ncbi:MAG: class I adenylate-forming enzyme family protein [Steroidobacteraceae bacterium]
MRTVRELIERNALCFPNREALVFGERRISHGTYAQRALRLASGLYRLGLRRQDRVAVLAMNCVEIYETYAAAEVGGFIAVPINFRLAPPEILQVLRDSGARILIFESQYTQTVARLRAESTGIIHYICIGSADCALSYEQVVAEGDAEGPPIRPAPDDYAWLLYTSGTTGRPKGVPWRQEKILCSARMCALASEMTGETRLLQITPAFHVGGKGYVQGTAWDGGCTVLHRIFDVVAMLETIQKERITHTFMVAAIVQAVVSVPNVESYDLSSLRQIFSAAAPIPVPVLRRALALLGPVFAIQYGCTEVGNISALPRWQVNPDGNAEDLRRLGSVGRVSAEIDMELLDEQGNRCPAGTPGEVAVRSPAMLDSYWNDANATIEAIRDGWYHTGDIGVYDEQGYLYLVDRKKDMIISGGENIYSREVEEALASHPAVADAAVVGVPDPKWVETVKGIVCLRSDQRVTEAELIAYCKTRIASYKCPKSIEFVSELPRLGTGKIDKPGLRARFRSTEVS